MKAFIYTLSCFGLMAFLPFLWWVGFSLAGGIGGICGVIVALFLIVWAACWFIEVG